MGKRILIVEDNEHNSYLLTYLLGKHGYETFTACNGFEAIEQARTLLPDLILMDIQMPEMDGYEAICQIRAIPETSHIPIVAVSSYAMVGDKEKALVLGCVGYIEKPIIPETFVEQIAKFI